MPTTLVGSLVPKGGRPQDRWRNFYYPTDPIGGPGQEQVDEKLLDPADCYYVYGQAPPASKGHSGYWSDPRVWEVINKLAARLATAPAPGSQPPSDGAEPVLTTGTTRSGVAEAEDQSANGESPGGP